MIYWRYLVFHVPWSPFCALPFILLHAMCVLYVHAVVPRSMLYPVYYCMRCAYYTCMQWSPVLCSALYTTACDVRIIRACSGLPFCALPFILLHAMCVLYMQWSPVLCSTLYTTACYVRIIRAAVPRFMLYPLYYCMRCAYYTHDNFNYYQSIHECLAWVCQGMMTYSIIHILSNSDIIF